MEGVLMTRIAKDNQSELLFPRNLCASMWLQISFHAKLLGYSCSNSRYTRRCSLKLFNLALSTLPVFYIAHALFGAAD